MKSRGHQLGLRIDEVEPMCSPKVLGANAPTCPPQRRRRVTAPSGSSSRARRSVRRCSSRWSVYCWTYSKRRFLQGRSGIIGELVIMFYYIYLYVTQTVLEVFNCNPTNPPDGHEYMSAVFVRCREPEGCTCSCSPSPPCASPPTRSGSPRLSRSSCSEQGPHPGGPAGVGARTPARRGESAKHARNTNGGGCGATLRSNNAATP